MVDTLRSASGITCVGARYSLYEASRRSVIGDNLRECTPRAPIGGHLVRGPLLAARSAHLGGIVKAHEKEYYVRYRGATMGSRAIRLLLGEDWDC